MYVNRLKCLLSSKADHRLTDSYWLQIGSEHFPVGKTDGVIRSSSAPSSPTSSRRTLTRTFDELVRIFSHTVVEKVVKHFLVSHFWKCTRTVILLNYQISCMALNINLCTHQKLQSVSQNLVFAHFIKECNPQECIIKELKCNNIYVRRFHCLQCFTTTLRENVRMFPIW